ncbi:TPA: hypothetical protein PVK60_003859 [Acinetobacter baumannii]|jgi:hypothetical protein|uniref:C2H2-type domain-containing protein n=2 Tax=Acinetobacter baumannii TaxID=470 RepID=A0AAV3JX93_ACIBA|nr:MULTISPECIES: hypothetical protein [Acinetobacter]AVI36995.1 hypothetical protein CSB68_1455 [Acinetobacter baumannii]EHZ6774924.1 hypothetical protein [Acinetobacter baumannii]EKU2678983.1 hypothetical protein [Acinetobacter baumannii]EKU3587022.1 hypothetical protein [Acinetobacter baumannii]EKU3590596.1 hypothetical protein [Acinetobacter baumannii]
MTFTLEELEDIWITYYSHGGVNNSKVLAKIRAEYTFCPLCDHLIPNSEYQQHFDDHD